MLFVILGSPSSSLSRYVPLEKVLDSTASSACSLSASPVCSLSRRVLLEASHGSASPAWSLSPVTLLAGCLRYVYDIDDSDYFSSQQFLCPLGDFSW